MAKLIELTRYSEFDKDAPRVVLINPEAVDAILEVCHRAGTPRSAISMRGGDRLDIREAPEEARKKLGI